MRPNLDCTSKRKYESPRLVVYGDLRHLTAGGGGNMADGRRGPETKA